MNNEYKTIEVRYCVQVRIDGEWMRMTPDYGTRSEAFTAFSRMRRKGYEARVVRDTIEEVAK